MTTEEPTIAARIVADWLARLPAAARDAISAEAVDDLVCDLDDADDSAWHDDGDDVEEHEGGVAVLLDGTHLGGGWDALSADTDDRHRALVRVRRSVEASIVIDLDRGEVVGDLPEGVTRSRVDRMLGEIVPMLRPPHSEVN